MPLARHDTDDCDRFAGALVSTHMPLARHDDNEVLRLYAAWSFYSHASCEA